MTFTTGRWHILPYVNILEVLNFRSEILNIFKELTVYCENDCKYNDLTLQITDSEEKIKSVLKEIPLILQNTSDITLDNDIQEFKAAINEMEKDNDLTLHWADKNIFFFSFLDLLAKSTALPAAFHSRNNDFCGPFFCFLCLSNAAKFII